MPELLLAIDVGTTTARAAVFTPDGRLEALSAAPLTSLAPRPGWVEQDAARVWRATRGVIAKVLAKAGRAARRPRRHRRHLAAHQHRGLGPGERRAGLAHGHLERSARRERAGELREAGFFLAPQQAAAKLEAVLAGVAAPPRRLAWGNIDSFLILKLSGGAVHATDASQAWPTGYLDLATMGWNGALIAHQRLDEALFPTLVDTWGPIGVTDARVFGAAVPITADIADQQSALIAHGEAAGVAKVTYGTAATLDLATGGEFIFKSPTAPPFVASSAGGQTRFCLEGMVLSAGAALDWLRTHCRLGDHARFEALAASVPDAGGAAFLPALQGLGAPYGDPAHARRLLGSEPSSSAPPGALLWKGGLPLARGVRVRLWPRRPAAAPGAGRRRRPRRQRRVSPDPGRPAGTAPPPSRHRRATAAEPPSARPVARACSPPAMRRAFARYEDPVEPRIGPDEATGAVCRLATGSFG